jgi:DNA-binding CsgD family transcriptional regulator
MNALSNREIGDRLFISFQTVKTHLKNIYKKTNVRNKMELSQLKMRRMTMHP